MEGIHPYSPTFYEHFKALKKTQFIKMTSKYKVFEKCVWLKWLGLNEPDGQDEALKTAILLVGKDKFRYALYVTNSVTIK